MAEEFQAPEKVSITNLLTEETLEAQLNPDGFDEGVNANWDRITTQGNSFEILHYKNTKNYEFGFDIAYRARLIGELEVVNKARLQLLSFSAPARVPGGVSSPPSLFVSWPQTLAIECKMTSCKIKVYETIPTGAVCRFMATLRFEQRSDKAFTSDQIANPAVLLGEIGLL